MEMKLWHSACQMWIIFVSIVILLSSVAWRFINIISLSSISLFLSDAYPSVLLINTHVGKENFLAKYCRFFSNNQRFATANTSTNRNTIHFDRFTVWWFACFFSTLIDRKMFYKTLNSITSQMNICTELWHVKRVTRQIYSEFDAKKNVLHLN